jgi:hypothetical protein
MKKAIFLAITAAFFYTEIVTAQNDFPYSVHIEAHDFPNLPGLHSYVFAQNDNKWLVIGGRKDGLHARQPFNTFPEASSNTDIYVIDIQSNQLWTSSVNTLATGLKEQLQSTNMNFYQKGDKLYIIGGYGFSQTANGHITYDKLTEVDVPGLMQAVINNQAITPFFNQIADSRFALTGGHLKMLGDTFYLVGGHKFDGRYNPMGNPTFTQEYTNQIRKFAINNTGSQLSIAGYNAITDPIHLRRRDYNLLPQIFPNGEEGLTISSGVFQINADLPFLYPVDITISGYTAQTSFNQYLSNYHSAVACVYDSTNNRMHNLFFGGMSQYYYDNDSMVKDDRVPFVKTVSRVSRDANGNLTEYRLPVEMPALHGASAEFIPNLDVPMYDSKVIKINNLNDDSVMIGYIYGGIHSPSLNPFSQNQTNTTRAENTVYKVWLIYDEMASVEEKMQGNNPYDITVYPNPFERNFAVKFKVSKNTKVSYFVSNIQGQILKSEELGYLSSGEHNVEMKLNKVHNQALFVNFIFDDKYYVSKTVIAK